MDTPALNDVPPGHSSSWTEHRSVSPSGPHRAGQDVREVPSLRRRILRGARSHAHRHGPPAGWTIGALTLGNDRSLGGRECMSRKYLAAGHSVGPVGDSPGQARGIPARWVTVSGASPGGVGWMLPLGGAPSRGSVGALRTRSQRPRVTRPPRTGPRPGQPTRRSSCGRPAVARCQLDRDGG